VQIVLVKNLLTSHRNRAWDKFSRTLNLKDNFIHKLNRKLLRKTPANTPLKDETGKLIFENVNKCELFADTMEEQFSLNPEVALPEVSDTIKKLNCVKTKSSYFTSLKQVWDIIKTLPNGKNPGPDKIPSTALKHLPKKAIIKLSNIFTACLKLSYFPNSWKTASIVMIPIPLKDHSKPDGYRPISLLSSISKVFEKIIIQKLNPHIKIRNE